MKGRRGWLAFIVLVHLSFAATYWAGRSDTAQQPSRLQREQAARTLCSRQGTSVSFIVDARGNETAECVRP